MPIWVAIVRADLHGPLRVRLADTVYFWGNPDLSKGWQAGTAADITGHIEIYTVTDNGIALQAIIAGTKYWKDDELN